VLIKPPSGPPTTQSFDANGNLTLQNAGGAFSTFAWDGENRMVGYQNPAGVVGTLLYSADGLRKAADVQDGSAVETWRFVWDGQNVLRKESSAPGVGNDIIRTTDYPGYWGGLASLFDSIAGSQILAFDPQGNVRLVLQGGSVAGTGAYTGFGEVLSDPGIPFAYVGLFGYQWDNPFYYVRDRYYDPTTGRWYSRDPLEPTDGDQGRNAYAFDDESPISNLDPNGEAPVGQGARTSPVSTPADCLRLCARKHGSCFNCVVRSAAAHGIPSWLSCPIAKYACSSNIDCGPGPAAPQQPSWGWPDCFARCIENNDPLNLVTKGIFTGIGGTIPKSWARYLGVRVSGFAETTRVTTIPSVISSKLEMGAGNPLRVLGRRVSPFWVAYGNYLALVETRCACVCAHNPSSE
jgi:RHS repeat-associated protein